MPSAVQVLRSNLQIFPQEYLPEISYTIEEVVGRDCYGLLERIAKLRKCVVVDIGANFGIFSLAAWHEAPDVSTRIIAIEPNPATFQALVQSTTSLINGCRPRIELGCHAFGDGSIISIDPGHSPFKARATDAKKGEHSTYAMPLDVLAAQYGLGTDIPVMLKIDCEGGETALLGGSHAARAGRKVLRTILDNGGSIGMEIHWGDKYPNFSGRTAVTSEEWMEWTTTHFKDDNVTVVLKETVGIIQIHGR